MIELKNVTKIYNSTYIMAIDNISLEIDDGVFVFLIGPSGAGKSTLIKLILHEEEISGGKMKVNGYDLGRLKRRQIPYLRRSVGIVFQDFRLLPDKTVFENIAFAMQIVGADRRKIERIVPQVLKLTGLTGKEKMKPHQLSGGEQQRAALARALANKPPVLIADEPTGNLDPDTAWEIMRLLEEVNKLGTTVIVATHAKDIVNRMNKRVIALKDGVIVRDEKEGQYDHV